MVYTINVAAVAGLEKIIADAAMATMAAFKTEVTSAQVVPFDNGDLQNDMFVEQNTDADGLHTALMADKPQARRLYYHPKYNFQTVNNPNAGAGWFEPWTPLGGQRNFLPDTFSAEIKKRMP